MEAVQDWWRTVPIVTKYLFAASMGLTLIPHFFSKIISPYSLILLLPPIYQQFQVC